MVLALQLEAYAADYNDLFGGERNQRRLRLWRAFVPVTPLQLGVLRRWNKACAGLDLAQANPSEPKYSRTEPPLDQAGR